VGVCLEAARSGVSILVDGFITTAAFAVAWKIEPAIKDYAFFSHVSVEPGHKALHQLMDRVLEDFAVDPEFLLHLFPACDV